MINNRKPVKPKKPPGVMKTPAQMQEIEVGRQVMLRQWREDNKIGSQPATFSEVTRR